MGTNKDSCYQCTDRKVGCHSNCVKYERFKAELEKKRQLIQEAKKQESVYLEYKKYSIRKHNKTK